MKKFFQWSKENVSKLAAILWIGIGFMVDVWYQLVPGTWILDSDLAGEMLLSNILNQEGSILSKNWYYTTELRVFETQWFYRIGLLIFPHNWHYARVLASALILLVVIGALLYFMKPLNIGALAYWAAGVVIWPFGFWELFLCTYGNYYFVYYIFSLFAFGALLRLYKKFDLKALIVLVITALCSGFNGIRQLLVLFIPITFAAFTLLLSSIIKKDVTKWKEIKSQSKEELRFFSLSVLAVAVNMAGYLFTNKVLSRIYEFETYESLKWGERSSTFETIYIDFLKLFGYQDNAELFSLEGIASGFGVVLALFFVVSFADLIRRNKKLSGFQRLLLLYLSSALILDGIIYVFLGNYNSNYWLPLLPFALITIALELATWELKLPGLRVGMAILCSFFVMTSSYSSIQDEIASPCRGKAGLYEAAKWMETNGYTKARSSFWNGDAVTEFTNGNVEVWIADWYLENGYEWLQPKSHYDLPTGDFVQIINLNEEENIEGFSYADRAELIYNERGILLYYIP